jgi:hypothetical protein
MFVSTVASRRLASCGLRLDSFTASRRRTDAQQASLKLQLMLAAAMRRRCFLSAAESSRNHPGIATALPRGIMLSSQPDF